MIDGCAKLTVTLDAEAKKVFETIKDSAAQLLIVSQLVGNLFL